MDNRPNPLLVGSAVLYFLAGAVALFAPQELLSAALGIYGVLAVLFGWKFFGSGLKADRASEP